MQVYLPIAEVAVPAESILLLGVLVGFMSGLFGVGGGFLTTPFLIFMGLPPSVAVGTQATQLVASGVSGALGHMRRGNVDIKMGGVMVCGSLAGTIIGVLIFRMLQYFGQIDVAISLLYVFLLGAMGILMFVESFMALVRKQPGDLERQRVHHHPVFQALPYKIRFPRSRLYVSALLPGGIGCIGGLLLSIMGMGGGFIMIPAMIYILGMPTLLAVGTSLFQIMITAAIATVMHAVTSHTVDLMLAALLIAGGVVGVQVGVRAGKKIKGAWARIILASILIIVSFQLAGQLLIKPQDLYLVEMR